MSKAPPLPPELVKQALEEYVQFSKTVIPLLGAACRHAKSQITAPPPGGRRCAEAERQLFPAFVRNAMHQLIEGHNGAAGDEGLKRIPRRHIRNGAVCMVVCDNEFRMLKSSSRHPTRPSGTYQEALITQKAYWDMVEGQKPLFRVDRQILGGLLYYHLKGMELLDAWIVIPNGFREDRGVIVADSAHVSVGEDLEKIATFTGDDALDILPDPRSTIVAPDALPDLGTGDPYAGLAEDYDSYEYYNDLYDDVLSDETTSDPEEPEDR